MSSGCKCGSSCKCGDNCSCGEGLTRGDFEEKAPQTIITGLAPPVKTFCNEKSEMNFGAENGGCKCGSSCSCDPCNCK